MLFRNILFLWFLGGTSILYSSQNDEIISLRMNLNRLEEIKEKVAREFFSKLPSTTTEYLDRMFYFEGKLWFLEQQIELLKSALDQFETKSE